MIARVLVLAAAITACVPAGGTATFVRDARIVGRDLVVTKCVVRSENGSLSLDACHDERRALPAVIIARAFDRLASALESCAVHAERLSLERSR